MPFANIKVPQGMITAEQKAGMIHDVTGLFVGLYGEDVRPHTMVLVEEVADGGYGRADQVFDLAFVARLQGPPAPAES
jgi:4-oxalocrotonate tautomerase